MILILKLSELLKRSLNKVSTSAPFIIVSLLSLIIVNYFLETLKESLLRTSVSRNIKLILIL